MAKRKLSDAEQSLEDFAADEIADASTDELRRIIHRLEKQLASAKGRTEDLVAAALQGARDAYLSVPRTVIPAPKERAGKGKPEAALWHLTDWQGGKRTSSYDTETMRERVRVFWEKARTITEIQRAHHPVKLGVILFGGDMLEGLFNFPRQVFEIDSSLFAQWANVSQLVIETVNAALSIYSEVLVVAEWGNHGRIGAKRDAVPTHDNVDRMIYEHARQMMKGTARLKWDDCPEDIQHVEVGNYRALLIHGDEIGRNGFASAQTIVKHVNDWRSGAHEWEFRDCYVGHYHTHREDSLADGEGAVFWTGSTESSNRYAGVNLARRGRPLQRLHFVDLEKGRVSAQYRVYL